MFRSSSNFDKLLDKATSNLRLEPDWPTILQICDLIRQGDVQSKYALAAIKKKLTHANPHVAQFGLMVLESCVKNCGSLIHDEIGTKQYMEQLRELVKTSPHENVKLKILELIQAWAFAFRNSPKYRAVQDTVHIMKTDGYKFPALKESDAMFSADTAPQWADGEVCHRCRVTFSVVQRKHHCRACGQVFCGQCSSKQSTLPKFGIEKEVRVCEACYEQVNKPLTATTKETDLPAEYLSSSLAQQQQVPPRKSADELREEEELHLAIALSKSEAEEKEKEKKRATSAIKKNTASVTARPYSPPPSPGPSPSRLQEEEEENPELAKYMNRKYWEQKKIAIEDYGSRADVASPSAPNINSPMPQKIVVSKQQNGDFDSEIDEFVHTLQSQVNIFVNRMKSNSSRGRFIANDSTVQSLFTQITAMHSQLLKYIQEQDDNRVHYEGLQDKLTQIKDARAALDVLREEHQEKLRMQAKEAERLRQHKMAQKLEAMRKTKQEYLQYQQQLTLQKIQEQEREMQMRQEQQKHQYMMGGYRQIPGFMGAQSQSSPVRHVQYPPPGANYNPMSPTNQGVYMYGQPSMNQYQMPSYGLPQMPPHMMGQVTSQDHQQGPADPSIQGRESLGRVSMSGPEMMPSMCGPPMQQPSGHQMSPGHQGPQSHMPLPQGPPGHVAPQQIPPGQMPQPSGPPVGPPGQMGHPPSQAPPGQMHPSRMPPNQMGPQPPSSMPPPHGGNLQPQTSATSLPPQNTGPLQVPPGVNNTPVQSNQPQLPGPPGAVPQITRGPPPVQFQSPAKQPVPPAALQSKDEVKPDTAELISFD